MVGTFVDNLVENLVENLVVNMVVILDKKIIAVVRQSSGCLRKSKTEDFFH